MSLEALSLETMSLVDHGKIAAALDLHLKRCSQDCIDRPGDANPRKVALTINLKPKLQQDGDVTDVYAEFEIASTVPKHRSRPIHLMPRHGGHLVFSPDSQDNAEQMTLDEA